MNNQKENAQKTTSRKSRFRLIGQRNRDGRHVFKEVDTQARFETLHFIYKEFRYEGFTIEEYLDEKLNSFYRNRTDKINKEKARINRAIKNGWVKKPDKNDVIYPSNKFIKLGATALREKINDH